MFRSFVDHVFRVHPRACADQRLVAIESETGSESRIGGLIVAKPEAKQRRLRALANLLGCAQEPAGLLRFPEQLSDVATAFHRPCDTPQMCNGKGIAHGFMPLESRRGEVTLPEQCKTDIHADKVMLMSIGAETPDGAQDVNCSPAVLFSQVQPTPYQSGHPAQQFIGMLFRQPLDGSQMFSSLLGFAEVNPPKSQMPARISLGPFVADFTRDRDCREQGPIGRHFGAGEDIDAAAHFRLSALATAHRRCGGERTIAESNGKWRLAMRFEIQRQKSRNSQGGLRVT